VINETRGFLPTDVSWVTGLPARVTAIGSPAAARSQRLLRDYT